MDFAIGRRGAAEWHGEQPVRLEWIGSLSVLCRVLPLRGLWESLRSAWAFEQFARAVAPRARPTQSEISTAKMGRPARVATRSAVVPSLLVLISFVCGVAIVDCGKAPRPTLNSSDPCPLMNQSAGEGLFKVADSPDPHMQQLETWIGLMLLHCAGKDVEAGILDPEDLFGEPED